MRGQSSQQLGDFSDFIKKTNNFNAIWKKFRTVLDALEGLTPLLGLDQASILFE